MFYDEIKFNITSTKNDDDDDDNDNDDDDDCDTSPYIERGITSSATMTSDVAKDTMK